MILSDRDGIPEVVGEPAWVLVYILDDDGTAFQYHEALVPDPCSDKPTPSTIVFPYDRQAAVEYTRIQSRYHVNGHIPPGLGKINGQNISYQSYYANNRQVGRITNDLRDDEPTLPFADFVYDIANLEVGTSSARYTSEVIWFGGMPMISSGGTCGSSGEGWYFCGDSISYRGKGSRWWNNHIQTGIIEHFESIPFQVISHSVYISIGINNNGNSNASLGSDLQTLVQNSIPNLPSIRNVTWGDYIISLHPTPEKRHGFIITGWGEPLRCDEAILKELDSNPVNHPELSAFPLTTNSVPYVSDFSGWIGVEPHCKDNNESCTPVSQILTPVSRPIYCMVCTTPTCTGPDGYNDNNGDRTFGFNDWRFYKMPSYIEQTTSDLFVVSNVFTQYTWVWSDIRIPYIDLP